jgi:hypothetical protein
LAVADHSRLAARRAADALATAAAAEPTR